MRFAALRAAIVPHRSEPGHGANKNRLVLTGTRKKSLEGIPRVLGQDRRQVEVGKPTKIEALTNTWEEG